MRFSSRSSACDGVLIGLGLQRAADVAAGGVRRRLQLGQFVGAEVFDELLAGLHIGVELDDRFLGLLVQIVEHGDVAPQRILVAVELQADTVDLPGNVLVFFLEAFKPRLEGAEQAAQEAPGL